METQTIEFTVEQLLDLHRYWITELFIMDKKSEEEIVNLLHHHQINVTFRTRFILISPIGIYLLHPPPPPLSKTGPTAIISSYATIFNTTTTALTSENSCPIPFTPSKPVLEGLGAISKYSTRIESYSLDYSLLKSRRFGKPTRAMEDGGRNPEISA
ncbi:uncharacterized protein Bfra_012233 [Botrytis fragariae]|uniref:Uncharacterized protein n=1 Tax=Botrytis fragariae TaxID=1964551 RepID=A0A8H6AJ40_9HELO|nr:uncharacterized protein Bfra_012233 [Botrytis fragariae]KAF5868586.1 hypothetical protein Bfra_012233 [Botrytis fragariae]